MNQFSWATHPVSANNYGGGNDKLYCKCEKMGDFSGKNSWVGSRTKNISDFISLAIVMLPLRTASGA